MNKKTPVPGYRLLSSPSTRLKLKDTHYDTPCMYACKRPFPSNQHWQYQLSDICSKISNLDSLRGEMVIISHGKKESLSLRSLAVYFTILHSSLCRFSS